MERLVNRPGKRLESQETLSVCVAFLVRLYGGLVGGLHSSGWPCLAQGMSLAEGLEWFGVSEGRWSTSCVKSDIPNTWATWEVDGSNRAMHVASEWTTGCCGVL